MPLISVSASAGLVLSARQKLYRTVPSDGYTLTYRTARLTDGGVWSNSSDRNRKTDFKEVDARTVLALHGGDVVFHLILLEQDVGIEPPADGQAAGHQAATLVPRGARNTDETPNRNISASRAAMTTSRVERGPF